MILILLKLTRTELPCGIIMNVCFSNNFTQRLMINGDDDSVEAIEDES